MKKWLLVNQTAQKLQQARNKVTLDEEVERFWNKYYNYFGALEVQTNYSNQQDIDIEDAFPLAIGKHLKDTNLQKIAMQIKKFCDNPDSFSSDSNTQSMTMTLYMLWLVIVSRMYDVVSISVANMQAAKATGNGIDGRAEKYGFDKFAIAVFSQFFAFISTQVEGDDTSSSTTSVPVSKGIPSLPADVIIYNGEAVYAPGGKRGRGRPPKAPAQLQQQIDDINKMLKKSGVTAVSTAAAGVPLQQRTISKDDYEYVSTYFALIVKLIVE
jgi:hypothetical protein